MASNGLISEDVAWDYDFALQNFNDATEAVNEELNGYHDTWEYEGYNDDYDYDGSGADYDYYDEDGNLDWDAYNNFDYSGNYDGSDWNAYQNWGIDTSGFTDNYVDMSVDATHYIDPVTGEYVAYDTAGEDWSTDSNDWDMDSSTDTAGLNNWGFDDSDFTHNYVDWTTDATHYIDPVTGEYVAYGEDATAGEADAVDTIGTDE